MWCALVRAVDRTDIGHKWIDCWKSRSSRSSIQASKAIEYILSNKFGFTWFPVNKNGSLVYFPSAEHNSESFRIPMRLGAWKRGFWKLGCHWSGPGNLSYQRPGNRIYRTTSSTYRIRASYKYSQGYPMNSEAYWINLLNTRSKQVAYEATASTMPSSGRAKSCTACRQVKLACNARMTAPDPCSRCQNSGLECLFDSNFKRIQMRK